MEGSSVERIVPVGNRGKEDWLKRTRAAEPQRFRDLMRRANRDRDASRVAVSILKADSKVAQMLERALADGGLTLPQFNLLMELAASPDASLPLYEINARLISTPPNTSWLCTRIEQGGLVKRRRDESDARVVIVQLTEKGWTALAKAAPLVFQGEKELLASYSRAELRSLAELLASLLR
ncbi:MAG: MarR family transcriptional regulator [Actinomycetota bacterium]|nr:MarR family transcriptional regulator [Actinomycetota bacterium]